VTTLHVATAVARRSLTHAFKNPALLIPSTIFPLVFLIAFAGGLSKVGDVPGFDYAPGYTAFQFVFVFLQSAAFGGVFTGFGVAADWESGFARRLLLASPRRTGLVLGYVIAGIVRWGLTALIVTVAALVAGMQVDGDGVQLGGLVVLAILVNATACLWGTGVALRLKTLQAGPLMQLPVFLVLFMAPVYVPRNLLSGWVAAGADLNPVTAILDAGRGFVAGTGDHTALALACGAGLVTVLTVWAMTGLRRVEAGR
jgi:ABC-2 type transport system permease protein